MATISSGLLKAAEAVDAGLWIYTALNGKVWFWVSDNFGSDGVFSNLEGDEPALFLLFLHQIAKEEKI